MKYSEDKISRTAGNVYEKADYETWLLYPRENDPYTFFNVFNYVLSDMDFGKFDLLNMEEVIEEVVDKPHVLIK